MRLVPKSRLLGALKPPTRAFSGLCALVGGDVALEIGVKLGRERLIAVLGEEGEGGFVVGGVDLDLDGIYIVKGDVGGVLSEHCGRNAVLVEHPGGDVGAHCVAEFGDSLEIFCHNL